MAGRVTTGALLVAQAGVFFFGGKRTRRSQILVGARSQIVGGKEMEGGKRDFFFFWDFVGDTGHGDRDGARP